MTERANAEEIMRKYGSRLEKEVKGFDSGGGYSRSYSDFKASMTPVLSSYERWCKALGNIVRIKPSKKDVDKIQRYLDQAHMNIAPVEAVSFSFMAFFSVFFIGILSLIGYWAIISKSTFSFDQFPIGLLFLLLIFSIFLFYFTYNLPERIAIKWRLKASSQMVPAILYLVIYMKHTSNFEKAVSFAAEHLEPPLALDFKKIFWDVEVGKYSTIKESVDAYLESWRGFSLEFIEAFHLIESSLFEPSESRRIAFLEKSLQVILDGVYDKMLKYTHEVKSPLTNLYMLGIVLPTLSLAILPLASTMLGGAITWPSVLVAFNLIIPFLVIYMTWNVVSLRPGGYGDSSYLEKNPLYYKYINKKAYWIAFFIALPIFLIGILPLLFMYTPLPEWIGLEGRDISWSDIGLSSMGNGGIFGIEQDLSGKWYGPMGILGSILSLFVPLSIAIFFIVALKSRTKELIKEREKYKEVEEGFTSSLFQLGNRMGDGVPAEIAFLKVAESSRGTSSEGFFRQVNQNIQQMGMSVEKAIFDSRRGAIIFYPSSLIVTSMKILVESVKKGLQVAARSLVSISDYVKNIKKIDDRMKDLLADILSDMKSNMVFLAPLLSGIIMGLAVMITTIIGGLGKFTGEIGADQTGGMLGGVSSFMGPDGLFQITEMIPPYWLQIIIGLYLIEIVFILTSTLVTIKSGKDDLETSYETALNLQKAMIFYFIVALISIISLSLLGSVVLKGIT
jgi:hypothetical protein